MKRIALTGLAAVLLASPALADPKFVGRTAADDKLKTDVYGAIAGYTKGAHACSMIGEIDMAPLGEKFEPKTPAYRATGAQHVYERWTVDACGTKRTFLVAMWTSPKGGTDYKTVEVKPGEDP